MMIRKVISVFSLVLMLTAVTSAQQWGTLKGRFILKGKAPEMKMLKVAGAPVCAVNKPMDERVIVDKGGELANVVIYARGSVKKVSVAVTPIHPDYQALVGTKVNLTNSKCRFEPRVAALWTQQILNIRNIDAFPHNSFGKPFNGKAFNPLVPAGGEKPIKIANGEKVPVKISCVIHPWMKSYVVVRPDPYIAISKKDGTFEIKNLPVGKLHFQFWHESLLYLKYMSFGGEEVKATKRKPGYGIIELDIKEGVNDLGDIEIDAAKYKKYLGKIK